MIKPNYNAETLQDNLKSSVSEISDVFSANLCLLTILYIHMDNVCVGYLLLLNQMVHDVVESCILSKSKISEFH